MTNFIKAGKTYIDRTGAKRECIFVEDDLAWLRRCKDDIAYVWRRDGISLSLAGHNNIEPPVEEKMQPPWDVLPKWARYVVMDKYGSVFASSCEPEKGASVWKSDGHFDLLDITELRFPRGNMPWDQSLVERPEDKTDE